MCYLIAKHFEKPGCVAVKTERGKALAALVKYLSLKTMESDIQILTITDLDVFSEYKPYNILNSEGEFIQKVLEESF